MKNLIIWGYPIEDIEKIDKLKIPFSDSIGIMQEFNSKKTQPKFDYPWVNTYIYDEIYPMPPELIICIKSLKRITFDFVPYKWDFYIISEKLMNYMIKNGFTYDFESGYNIFSSVQMGDDE